MKKNDLSRRTFLRLSGMGMAGIGMPNMGPAVSGGKSTPLTAGDVIERIKGHVGIPWKTPTVDTIKGGNAGIAVTGITTTFMATLDVIHRPKKRFYLHFAQPGGRVWDD